MWILVFLTVCVQLWMVFSLLFIKILLLFNWTANGFLPGGSDTTMRHNTHKYTYHTKWHIALKQNTAHKSAEAIKVTLHAIRCWEFNLFNVLNVFKYFYLLVFKYTTRFGPTYHIQVYKLVSDCRSFNITAFPRCSVVVKALCYKPEGRRFEIRWGEFLNLPNLSGLSRPWGLLSL
jgi:hypothetical protein